MVVPRSGRCLPHRRVIIGLWLRRRRVLLIRWERGWNWEWEYDSDFHNLYLDHHFYGSGHASPERTDHGERSVLRYNLIRAAARLAVIEGCGGAATSGVPYRNQSRRVWE